MTYNKYDIVVDQEQCWAIIRDVGIQCLVLLLGQPPVGVFVIRVRIYEAAHARYDGW